MSVSRETEKMLRIYAALLEKWNPRINLVASATIKDAWLRHIEDSLQLADLADPQAGRWADLGTGGGLPGIVLAIAKAETALRFFLVESDRRKAAFLATVVRALSLANVSILPNRIESLPSLNADYLSARALAPLPQLMSYVDQHLSPTGTAFLMKGRLWRTELENARADWRFDCKAHPSRTQDGAAILEISGVLHGAA